MADTKKIKFILIFLLTIGGMTSLVSIGFIHDNTGNAIDQTAQSTPNAWHIPASTLTPSPTSNTAGLRSTVYSSVFPPKGTFTILPSTGGTTYPDIGQYFVSDNIAFSAVADDDYVFTGWEITLGEMNWTEPPTNPYVPIFYDSIVKPIFTYIGNSTEVKVPVILTFGETGYGFEDGYNPVGYKPASHFQMLNVTGASITKITCYMNSNVTDSRAKMAVYLCQSGLPGELLGISSEVNLNSSAGFSWVDFNFSTPIPVEANGYYWFALMSNNDVWLRCTTTNETTFVYNHNQYNNDFTNPYGPIEGGGATVASVYATITIP